MFLKDNSQILEQDIFKLYDNNAKNDYAPRSQKKGQQVFEMARNIQVLFGKKNLVGTKGDRNILLTTCSSLITFLSLL